MSEQNQSVDAALLPVAAEQTLPMAQSTAIVSDEEYRQLPGPMRARQMILRYLRGEKIAEQCEKLGITKQAASKALLQHCPNEWRDAQAAMAQSRLLEAQEQADTAREERIAFTLYMATGEIPAGASVCGCKAGEEQRLQGLWKEAQRAQVVLGALREVEKGRELTVKHAQWECERLNRALYGSGDQPPPSTPTVFQVIIGGEQVTVTTQAPEK